MNNIKDVIGKELKNYQQDKKYNISSAVICQMIEVFWDYAKKGGMSGKEFADLFSMSNGDDYSKVPEFSMDGKDEPKKKKTVVKTKEQIDFEQRIKTLINSKYNLGSDTDIKKLKALFDENGSLRDWPLYSYDVDKIVSRFEQAEAKCEFLDGEINRVWAHVDDALGSGGLDIVKKDEILNHLRKPKDTWHMDSVKLEKELDLVRTTVKGLVNDVVKSEKSKKAFIESLDKGQQKQNLIGEIGRQHAIFADIVVDLKPQSKGYTSLQEDIRGEMHAGLKDCFAMGIKELEKRLASTQHMAAARIKERDGKLSKEDMELIHARDKKLLGR